MQISFINNFNTRQNIPAAKPQLSFGTENVPLYAIDESGNICRFNSIKEASKTLGLNLFVVRAALSQNRRINGVVLRKASDIEIPGSSEINTSVIEESKKIVETPQTEYIKKKKEETFEQPIYAITKTSVRKFNSILEAAEALSMLPQEIINSANASKTYYEKGYIFMRSNKMEIQKSDGSIEINRKFIEEFFQKRNIRKIYAISKDGYKVYENLQDLLKEIKLGGAAIRNALGDNNYPIIAGYIFVMANNLEHLDDSFNLVTDEKKIETLKEKI